MSIPHHLYKLFLLLPAELLCGFCMDFHMLTLTNLNKCTYYCIPLITKLGWKTLREKATTLNIHWQWSSHHSLYISYNNSLSGAYLIQCPISSLVNKVYCGVHIWYMQRLCYVVWGIKHHWIWKSSGGPETNSQQMLKKCSLSLFSLPLINIQAYIHIYLFQAFCYYYHTYIYMNVYICVYM